MCADLLAEYLVDGDHNVVVLRGDSLAVSTEVD